LNGKITVMLSTEGTYPFHQGGVSTWCDILVSRLKSVDYIVYSILMDPFVTQKFKLRQGSGLVKMPLWGTEEPSEHLTMPFSQVYLSKKRTDAKAVREHFLPLFRDMIDEIVSPVKDPHRFAGILLGLYRYFQTYEYKMTFKSEEVWDTYKSYILAFTDNPANQFARPDVYSMIQSLGWIYRFFNILNTPVPKTNVTHASAAAFCGIPCVIAKLEHGTPFMLTEHGVYLREQYLSLGKREYSTFLNSFLMRFIHSVSGLNYAFADQVSPVCQYNTRWEKRLHVEPDKIKVIYNGVDTRVFTEAGMRDQTAPTVVAVARIDPIKDILTLIQSAALVREAVPNVKYIVYGSVSVPDYYEECLALRDRLNLQTTFIFAGHTSNMAAAYQSGDVIALSSISEAFPYSVVEAMMTGKPCIATDVGGIKEALADTGILVNPRDPEALAKGTIELLQNGELRESLGKDGRERALNFFTLERVLELHLKSYIKLAVGAEERIPAASAAAGRRRVAASYRDQVKKAYALQAQGRYREAIAEFRLAVKQAPDFPFTPVLLTELANLYNLLGEYDRAFLEMEKHEALVQLLESRQTA
jgi:glycosyltransferase involved in cell wall biosynthesis